MRTIIAKATTLLVLCLAANAGYGGSLVTNAYIQSIENTAGNQALFAITIMGGTGICAGQKITFPIWAAVDGDTHKRAYSLALMAFSMGTKVSVWNYIDNSCTSAAYITTTK